MVETSNGCARLAVSRGEVKPASRCSICGGGPCTEYGDGSPPPGWQIVPSLETVEEYLRTVNRIKAIAETLHYLLRDLPPEGELRDVYEVMASVLSAEQEALRERKAELLLSIAKQKEEANGQPSE